ncbi:MAG TPA: nitrous oxide reductase family maturation protein NosD, partial [Saprospirales bacterium]|nr:nitrous oxide reductase family maturation protein NosD [Saprospirales bacterium]
MIRIILILTFLIAMNSLQAKVIEVCSSCSVKTIKEGIRQAADYDVVLVKKGTYREYNIEVRKRLIIRSQGRAVIDALTKGHVFQVFSDRVTIEGFHFKNVAHSYTKEYAAVLL